MKTLNLILLVVLAVITAGCSGVRHAEAVDRICLGNIQVAEAISAGEDILARMHFSIDKSDPGAGLVRTMPLSGGQFFEFWRKDNVGFQNHLESNIHSIQRTAELAIAPGREGYMCINCTVNVRRLNLEEKQLAGSGRVYDTFSASKSSLQQLDFSPLEHHAERKRQAGWVDIGRDRLLETEILSRLSRRLTGH